MHDDFRLIMTTAPSNKFPTSILALSIKVANEPPKSLKANMMIAYSSYTKDMHDELPEVYKPMLNHWKRTLFGLSFFYAQLLERKRFGPIGYNSNYDFTI